MARFDDASLRPAWGSWLVASVVMAIPLVWVGSQSLAEPLYVAGSNVVVRVAASKGHDPIQNHSHALAMTPH